MASRYQIGDGRLLHRTRRGPLKSAVPSAAMVASFRTSGWASRRTCDSFHERGGNVNTPEFWNFLSRLNRGAEIRLKKATASNRNDEHSAKNSVTQIWKLLRRRIEFDGALECHSVGKLRASGGLQIREAEGFNLALRFTTSCKAALSVEFVCSMNKGFPAWWTAAHLGMQETIVSAFSNDEIVCRSTAEEGSPPGFSARHSPCADSICWQTIRTA